MRTGLAAVAVMGLGCAMSGCAVEGDALVFGTIMRGAQNPSEHGELLLVRVVPDHEDGFSPDRPYRGDRVLEGSCPLQHTEFPVDFSLFDHAAIVEDAPPRWVMVAWIGHHDREIWPSAGQLYGTQAFRFARNRYGDAWTENIVVELDSVAPQ